MNVSEVMTKRVRSCSPRHSLDAVMQIMWEEDLGVLPVVNEEGQPIAMITDRDVSVAAYTQGKPLTQIQVRTAMSQQLYTAHVSDKLGSAEHTMREHQLRRLPVVDESTRLVGVLSLGDIAQAHARSALGRTVEHPLSDVARTLAAITQPRAASADTGSPPDEDWARPEARNAAVLRETPRTSLSRATYAGHSSPREARR